MGVDTKFKNPMDLWWDKAYGKDNRDVDAAMEERAWWGHALEDDVVQWFQEFGPEHTRKGKMSAYETGTLFHGTYTWMGCTPDRLLFTPEVDHMALPMVRRSPDDPRLIGCPIVEGYEGKATSFFAKKYWGPSGGAGVADYVWPQVQWAMAFFGLPRWYVACVIGGQEGRWYEVPRDDEWIGRAIHNAERFWKEHVLTKEPPTDWVAE